MAGVRRALVVDDEQAICTYTARILEEEGFEVTTTSNPDVGLVMLGEDGPLDLLVTDVRMPNVDGITLARVANYARPGLPILLITGYAPPDFDLNTEPWLVDLLKRCILKPFRIDQLAQAVRRLFPA